MIELMAGIIELFIFSFVFHLFIEWVERALDSGDVQRVEVVNCEEMKVDLKDLEVSIHGNIQRK